MRLNRPLVAVVLAGAVLLVGGRAFAFLYTEDAWYAALDARELWLERLSDATLLNTATFVAAAAFAFINLSAVRHSILSLVLPRRLANVEFAEAVPPRRLDFAAVILALLIAALAASAMPDWTSLTLVRAGVRFGEIDPYHQFDLGFYVTWLPLEMQLHTWAWAVVLITAVAVIGLYALTPGLRWEDGAVRMTSYVRRHFAVLLTIILVMLAWRTRITTFTLLFDGSGPEGAFTEVDHRRLLPAYVLLGLTTLAAAAVFLWSAWGRQLGLSFVVLTGVLLLWTGVAYVLPLLTRSPAPDQRAASAPDAPYLATREAFTRRAFDHAGDGEPDERLREGSVLTRSPEVERMASMAHIAPGARGYLLVAGLTGSAAPSIQSLASRLAHAWSEQDTRLLRGDMPPRARILRFRDVGHRVRRLAPVFVQGSRPAAMFRADTLYWITDLYTASATYPLSRRFTIAGERRGYFRHAATAYTHGSTGAVTIVVDQSPDPIAAAWQRRFPTMLRRAESAPQWIAELALEPAAPLPQTGEGEDRVFRARVRELYLRMRAALSTSDLAAFGEAFDSLGALLGRTPGENTR